MGQGVVWYTGQFYALFFLQSILKVDGYTANLLIAWSLLFGTGFFIVFGALSDKIGRKPIILAGCLIAALTFFPIFRMITTNANPALEKAIETVRSKSSPIPQVAAICSTRSAPACSPRLATPPAPSSPSPSVKYSTVARRRQVRGVKVVDQRQGRALHRRQDSNPAVPAALQAAGYPKARRRPAS